MCPGSNHLPSAPVPANRLPHWKRAIHRTYLELLQKWAEKKPDPNKTKSLPAAFGYDRALSVVMAADPGQTVLPAWLRRNLPDVRSKLERGASAAKNSATKLHDLDLADRLARLLKTK